MASLVGVDAVVDAIVDLVRLRLPRYSSNSLYSRRSSAPLASKVARSPTIVSRLVLPLSLVITMSVTPLIVDRWC